MTTFTKACNDYNLFVIVLLFTIGPIVPIFTKAYNRWIVTNFTKANIADIVNIFTIAYILYINY